MATAVKDVMDGASVLALSPHDIIIGERQGAFWPDKAAALGKMMAQDGQIVPIIVRKSGPRAAAPWTLVAGHHRLEGAKLEGFAIIDAVELIGSQDDYLKAEALENTRPTRSPLERACFVRAIAEAAEKRLKDLHGDLTPEQIKARARWDAVSGKAPGVERDGAVADAEADNAAANFAAAYQWQDSTAEAIGMSKRTVRDDLALHRALVVPFPTLWRGLATHPIVGENASALREIASYQSIEARRAIIEGLIEAPDMTLAQALEGLGLSKPAAPAATGATKFMNNAASNIDRLSAEQQRSWAPAFAETIKPSALEAMRAAIDARIAQLDKKGGAA